MKCIIVKVVTRILLANYPLDSTTSETAPYTFREMIMKTMPRCEVSKLEGHLFRLYDTNNDDHIDFVEFMNIFKMLTGGDPREILTNLFRVFDLDGDQQITVLEMETLVKDLSRWFQWKWLIYLLLCKMQVHNASQDAST